MYGAKDIVAVEIESSRSVSIAHENMQQMLGPARVTRACRHCLHDATG